MEKKTIPHKDTFLTLTNYKEPLKAIPQSEGHGYYGTISVTLDGDKMQCHVCGELYSDVALHSYQKHKMTGDEYRERYEIARSTSLISETERFRRSTIFTAWWQSLDADQKRIIRQKQRDGRIAWQKKRAEMGNPHPVHRLETKNKRGTCPDQLLDRIQECAKALGRTPSKWEFVVHFDSQRYVHLIYKTFGSWKKAVELAGLPPKPKLDQHEYPSFRDYSDEQLLDYLVVFAQENNKVPTSSDFRRGLLPAYETYLRHFGTIEKARELSGLYKFVSKETLSSGGYASRKK